MTEQMKPSGIEWIGDIPNDWKIQRFKFCGAVLYGCPFNSDFFTNEDTGIPLIRIRDITSVTTLQNIWYILAMFLLEWMAILM